MNKLNLRKNLKNYSVNATQKSLEETYLLNALWNAVMLHRPGCIGLYASIENEVDLTPIFTKANMLGICTAYPRIDNDYITFHTINSLDALNTKTFGILEPHATAPLAIPDLIIVPGLAFTKSGKRLGRGKGHYDRYLSKHSLRTVSLAFSWQLLDDLPTEAHDIEINEVIYAPHPAIVFKNAP